MNTYIYKYVQKRVDISILVIIDDSDIIEYDRRRAELPNTLLHLKRNKTPPV